MKTVLAPGLTMEGREDEMPEMLLPRPWSSGTSDVNNTHFPLNTAQNNGSVYDEVIANNMPVSPGTPWSPAWILWSLRESIPASALVTTALAEPEYVARLRERSQELAERK